MKNNYFVCHVPFQYYAFRSAYKQLENSCFIIPPFSDKKLSPQYGGGMSANGQYEYLYDFLQEKDVAVADYGEMSVKNFSDFLNKNAKSVITAHTFDCINYLKGMRIIRFMYGLANKESSTFRLDYNFLMDAVLTYGENTAEAFKINGIPAAPVGNMLFDDWFNDHIDEDSLSYILNRIDRNKQTILYLPTHSNYSSLDRFFDAIIKLSRQYNVITKLHHMTFNGEANRLCRLSSHLSVIALGDYFDPLPLYKVSDIVLTDVSGALFDAILTDRPVVMLGSTFGQYELSMLDNADEPSLKAGNIPSAKDPVDLEDIISRNIGKPISLGEKLMHELYCLRDGNAGRRAADIIREDAGVSFLSTVEKYENAIRKLPDSEERSRIIYFRDKLLGEHARPSPQTAGQKIKKLIKSTLRLTNKV